MENTNHTNTKLKGALTRGLVALLVAVFLLIVTNFAFIDLIRGPEQIGEVNEEAMGDYISSDIYLTMDIYAENYNSRSDKVTEWYAVVPHNGEFITFILPARYFDSVGKVLDDTYSLLNGLISSPENYFTVSGTIVSLDDDAKAMLYDWFGQNKSWMTSAGIVGDTTDYADIVSSYAIHVDSVGSLSIKWVYILTGAALLCLIYILVIFLLWCFGKYKTKETELDAENAENEDIDNSITDECESFSSEAEEAESELVAEDIEAEYEANEEDESKVSDGNDHEAIEQTVTHTDTPEVDN